TKALQRAASLANLFSKSKNRLEGNLFFSLDLTQTDKLLPQVTRTRCGSCKTTQPPSCIVVSATVLQARDGEDRRVACALPEAQCRAKNSSVGGIERHCNPAAAATQHTDASPILRGYLSSNPAVYC
ncbi:unnamed protein product, partial [Ectocarpus sp. 4 AP-2014]